jgi:hypothetical protein
MRSLSRPSSFEVTINQQGTHILPPNRSMIITGTACLRKIDGELAAALVGIDHQLGPGTIS